MSTTLIAAFLATGMRLVASHGYADGAPPGFSGGFREESCHACHFHETVNAAPGTLAIEGLPGTFTPGQRYTLKITLTRDGMKRAGFQLAARFADDGTQAGTLMVGSSDARRIKLENQGGVLYAGQNKTGSEIVDGGKVRWSVDWIAPVGGRRAVRINVAANAADGDERVDGDFIYTAIFETSPPPFAGVPAARTLRGGVVIRRFARRTSGSGASRRSPTAHRASPRRPSRRHGAAR